MNPRPLTFAQPGKFEIYCHRSTPTLYPEEAHETVQICVPLDGAQYNVTRQSETGRKLIHHLGARDVLALPIGQPHCVDWRRTADIVSLQLSEGFIADALGLQCLRIQDAFTLRDPFISSAAAQLRTSLQVEGSPSLIFAEAIATAIAYHVGLGAKERRGIRGAEHAPALSATALARLERFIDENLDQPISLTMLAKQTGLSLWHFMRRFRISRGMSPHDFITRRRLARAKTLLSQSRLSITQIALEVGMSHSHFSRTFLSRVGASPREFRRQRRR
jgi:AraC family transcriptional regulator